MKINYLLITGFYMKSNAMVTILSILKWSCLNYLLILKVTN